MKSRRSLNLLEICKDKRTCPKYIKKYIEAAVRESILLQFVDMFLQRYNIQSNYSRHVETVVKIERKSNVLNN